MLPLDATPAPLGELAEQNLQTLGKRLVQAHTAECQRIHKTLEDASIRLGSVAADLPAGHASQTSGDVDPFVGLLLPGRRRALPFALAHPGRAVAAGLGKVS